jgi:predicted RNA-binding protein with EMAP domain
MCYLRTKDERLISPYELKDFLETIFNRESAEKIIDACDEQEYNNTCDPRELNGEYLEHLAEHYDSSDTIGTIENMVDAIRANLGKIKSKNPALRDVYEGLGDLMGYIRSLAVVAE